MNGTLTTMRTLLAGVVLLVGCAGSSGDGDGRPVVVPPPETVNLMVLSPFDFTVVGLQYKRSSWPDPWQPEPGWSIEHNTQRSLIDLKPGAYDFQYGLRRIGSARDGITMNTVDVRPDENGDFLLEIPDPTGNGR